MLESREKQKDAAPAAEKKHAAGPMSPTGIAGRQHDMKLQSGSESAAPADLAAALRRG
jgi:hypothetical protein